MSTILTVIGRLGADPVSRVTGDGKKLVSLSLASSCGFGDKKQTIWWKCTIWGDRFDKLFTFIKKGSGLVVTGSLSRAPELYTHNGVQKVSSLELTVDMINLLPSDKKEEAKQDPELQSQKIFAQQQEFVEDSDLPF